MGQIVAAAGCLLVHDGCWVVDAGCSCGCCWLVDAGLFIDAGLLTLSGRWLVVACCVVGGIVATGRLAC